MQESFWCLLADGVVGTQLGYSGLDMITATYDIHATYSFGVLNGVEGTMAELERGERLQIMLNSEELSAVEDFRFHKRMPSRAAAVRELLRRGLLSEGFMSADAGARSQDFGVLSSNGEGNESAG